jgi:hypothetical protein
MSLLDRTMTFLVDRIAPRLIFGRPRDEAALAALEREACAEIEACIARGRPGPEESRPRRPEAGAAPAGRPRVAVRRSRPVDVHAVSLAAIVGPVPARPVVEVPLSERPA